MFDLLLKNQLSAPKKLKFKNEILARVQGRNSEALNDEIKFYKTELLPYFIKLSQQNPVFSVTDLFFYPVKAKAFLPLSLTVFGCLSA